MTSKYPPYYQSVMIFTNLRGIISMLQQKKKRLLSCVFQSAKNTSSKQVNHLFDEPLKSSVATILDKDNVVDKSELPELPHLSLSRNYQFFDKNPPNDFVDSNLMVTNQYPNIAFNNVPAHFRKEQKCRVLLDCLPPQVSNKQRFMKKNRQIKLKFLCHLI